MELILRLYLLPYNPLRPVFCFDERPCFLIGDTVEGIEMKEGSPKKENYAYSKHGSCCILAAIEPKTGHRLAHIRKQRRSREFAIFMKNLAAENPLAEKILVVLDNLNTHGFAAFYQTFSAEQAAALCDRFEFIYTPKSASWLNMIEIEFSVLSRFCLNRRIPSIELLANQVLTFFSDRMAKKVEIHWEFSRQTARQKLNSHYQKVHPENSKFAET